MAPLQESSGLKYWWLGRTRRHASAQSATVRTVNVATCSQLHIHDVEWTRLDQSPTMIFHSGRSVARLRAQCFGNCRTLVTFSTTERVPALYTLRLSSHDTTTSVKSNPLSPIIRRAYADRPVSRPKAHTGRTTAAARRAPTTSATKAAKKPAPKKTTPKAVPKAKPRAKPKSKAKPKKKAKAKPKQKPKRKVLTEKQKAAKSLREKREKLKELRKKALLDSPKRASSTAWTVFISERLRAKSKATKPADVFKESRGPFRALTPEQLEVSFETQSLQRYDC